MRIPSAKGWVLYDGDCAFCVRWAHRWSPVLRRRGFEIEAVQADWVPAALGMEREEARHDIRLLTASGPDTTGATFAGADVYLYVARRIWWAWPFGMLFSLPGFNLLIRAGYRWFAANRYCVSGYCGHKT
jgi:predicted DCC family thiol-disulfide oxidoreductase YuxK